MSAECGSDVVVAGKTGARAKCVDLAWAVPHGAVVLVGQAGVVEILVSITEHVAMAKAAALTHGIA